ncbi:MAG: DUF4375 domain-containing protein [Pirellulales bacterium]
MDFFELTAKYHEATFDKESDLDSLPEEWQRELAALWRMGADISNGSYLQFISNWSRPSYEYGSQALRKIGADAAADLVDECQALIDKQLGKRSTSWWRNLLPFKRTIHLDGQVEEGSPSELPTRVVNRVLKLSYDFMDKMDEIGELGMAYYGKHADSK